MVACYFARWRALSCLVATKVPVCRQLDLQTTSRWSPPHPRNGQWQPKLHGRGPQTDRKVDHHHHHHHHHPQSNGESLSITFYYSRTPSERHIARGRCSQLGWPEPHIADRIAGAGIAKLLCCPRSTGKPERGPDSARRPDGSEFCFGFCFLSGGVSQAFKEITEESPRPKGSGKIDQPHTTHPMFWVWG